MYILGVKKEEYQEEKFDTRTFKMFLVGEKELVDYRNFFVALVAVLPIESEDKLAQAFDLFDCS